MIDELGQDYFAYRERMEKQGKHHLDFNPWLLARLNALEDQLQSLMVLMTEQQGDGK